MTQQTDNMQVPYTTEITSTNVENINMQNDVDTEEAEEQIAINHRQELTGDPLPTVVQYENLENPIYQCAPGENNIPKYLLLGYYLCLNTYWKTLEVLKTKKYYYFHITSFRWLPY